MSIALGLGPILGQLTAPSFIARAQHRECQRVLSNCNIYVLDSKGSSLHSSTYYCIYTSVNQQLISSLFTG